MNDVMIELRPIMSKYDENYVANFLEAGDTLDRYALNFCEDVVEIYDLVSRLRQEERNPTGFSSNDAAILGLLIRTWKLLKQALQLHKAHHAEFILVVERSVVEAAVMATYLLKNNDSIVEDYRMCSYRNRLRILRELQTGLPFAATKPGQRLLNSIQEKLERDNLTQSSFSRQDAHGWRVQGKTFFDIFEEVVDPQLYRSAYGVLSETVHGSWLESVDWSLTQHRDGTFSPRYELDSAPIGFVSLLLPFSTPPYRLWVERIQVDNDNISLALNWIDKFNSVLLEKYNYLLD